MLLTLSVHSCVRISKRARIRVVGQLREIDAGRRRWLFSVLGAISSWERRRTVLCKVRGMVSFLDPIRRRSGFERLQP